MGELRDRLARGEVPPVAGAQFPTEDEETSGNSAIGLDLYHGDGTYAGRLVRHGNRLLLGIQRRGQDDVLLPFRRGDYFTAINGVPHQALSIASDGSILASSSAQRFFSDLGDGSRSASGTGRPSIGEEIQLLERQSELARREGREADARRFENDLRLLRERARLEQAEAGRERQFRERMDLLSQLTNLAQAARQFQQQATQQAVDLTGRDPLRAATLLQGGIQRGITPAQALRGNLLSIANAQLPQANLQANNLGLRGQVGQLQNFLSLSPVRPAFGLAQGGMVDLRPGEAVLVGEGMRGEGIQAGTAEVIERTPTGIRVIPLRAAAQTGADIDFQNPSNIPSFDALSPIFQHIGITGGIPIARQRPSGLGLELRLPGQQQLVPTPSFSTEAFRQLGIQPRLIRAGGRNFVVGPNGEIFAAPEGTAGNLLLSQMGLQPQQFLDIGGFGELEEFANAFGLRGEGGAFGFRALQPETLPLVEPFSPLETLGAPIVMPLGAPGAGPFNLGLAGSGSGSGLFLPAPEAIASLLPQLDPVTLEQALRAYELAGVPREAFISRAEAFTPTGSAQFGLAAAPTLG